MTVPIHQTTSLAYEPQVIASTVIEEEEIKEDVKEVSSDIEIYCNCWKTLKELYYPQLPNVNYILSNLTKEVGDIAVFYYSNSGLYHFAKVIEYDDNYFSIDEGNYYSCQRSERILKYNYPHLIGFYKIE